jgi:hypothetical protein
MWLGYPMPVPLVDGLNFGSDVYHIISYMGLRSSIARDCANTLCLVNLQDYELNFLSLHQEQGLDLELGLTCKNRVMPE